MSCPLADICGGCPQRNKSVSQYQSDKIAAVERILSALPQPLPKGEPVFVADGTRRRAALAFRYRRGKLTLGFNRHKSSEVIDVEACQLLTPALNAVLPALRRLLTEVCAAPYQSKKGKKTISQTVNAGDVWLCEAENGIDVVLEYDAPLGLTHRMIMFEQVSACPGIVRLSHRCSNTAAPEPVIEKAKPYIKIGGFDVFIPAGTFLQPSREGEAALTGLVQKYLGDTTGKIFDLFCGVGTFSYVLAANQNNKVTAVDSSEELLRGFRESVNRNCIANIEIITRNLFKYPLDTAELQGAAAVVFDPPRAGAAAVVKMLCAARPPKIIAVSCNPGTFVNDAAALLAAGYRLEEITLVDQFTYSDHSELVALFTN